MFDRPDIETGIAGAGRDRQGDGKNERPLPYPSRPRCVLDLEASSVRQRKLHVWPC